MVHVCVLEVHVLGFCVQVEVVRVCVVGVIIFVIVVCFVVVIGFDIGCF